MKKKRLIFALFGLSFILLFSCNNNNNGQTAAARNVQNDDFYFDYTIDGKEVHLDTTAILTSYNEFSASDREFKIFAGTDAGPNLVLTTISAMSEPSSTPNGSPEPGSKLGQGSVSLQNYPTKGITFNSYDFLTNPKPAVIDNAIVIAKSEKLGDIARILTGTVNVTVRGNENGSTKDHVIKGKFRIKHTFNGIKF